MVILTAITELVMFIKMDLKPLMKPAAVWPKTIAEAMMIKTTAKLMRDNDDNDGDDDKDAD